MPRPETAEEPTAAETGETIGDGGIGADDNPGGTGETGDRAATDDVGGRATHEALDAEGPDRPRARRRLPGRSWLANRSLASLFLVIAIPLGTFLVFAVPPFQGLDESNHFFRVWSLSQGVIVPPHVHAGTTEVETAGQKVAVPPSLIRPGLKVQGVVVPRCVDDYSTDNYLEGIRNAPMDDRTFWHTPKGCAHSPPTFVAINNTAINSPVAYAPQVVGVALLRLFGAPLPVVFYGGRLFGLAGFLALVALAIRLTPRGKGLLFLIGLLPMSLEGAAGFSADPMTLSLAMLVVALTIRCCLDDDVRWPMLAGLAVSAWALALCKEPYGLLAVLVLLVPGARVIRAARSRWALTTRAASLIKVGVLAVAGVLAAGWAYVGVRGSSLTNDYPPGQINPSYQLHYFGHHPLSMVADIARTWVNPGSQTFTLSGVVSSMGFFRNQTGAEVAPMALVVVVFVALFGTYVYEIGPVRRGLTALRRGSAWVPVVLAVGMAVLIYAEYAVRLTPPGSSIVAPIHGVQGRLFLPMFAVPMVTVALLRKDPDRRLPIGWLLLAVAIMAFYLVAKVFTRFY